MAWLANNAMTQIKIGNDYYNRIGCSGAENNCMFNAFLKSVNGTPGVTNQQSADLRKEIISKLNNSKEFQSIVTSKILYPDVYRLDLISRLSEILPKDKINSLGNSGIPELLAIDLQSGSLTPADLLSPMADYLNLDLYLLDGPKLNKSSPLSGTDFHANTKADESRNAIVLINLHGNHYEIIADQQGLTRLPPQNKLIKFLAVELRKDRMNS